MKTKTTRGTAFRSLAFLSLLLATMSAMKLTAVAQQPAARPDRGIRPAGSYAISDIESIDLVNGNLSLSVPLASLPPIAGGKMSYGLSAVYNSKLWDVARDEQIQNEPPVFSLVRDTVQLKDFPGWRIQAGYNFGLRDSRVDFDWEMPNCDFGSGGGNDPDCGWFRHGNPPVNENNWHKWFFVTPDGAEHEMKPVGFGPFTGSRGFLWGYYKEIPDTVGGPMTFYSFDGSFIWLKANPTGDAIRWEAFLPDGTKIVQRNNGIQRITDPNGNQIKIDTTFDGAGNSTVHIQDVLTGREIKKEFIPGPGNSFTERVSYQTVGGGWASIDVVYEQTLVFGKTYDTMLPPQLLGGSCTRPTDLGITTLEVVRNIVLPTTETGVERKFQFTYTTDSPAVPVNLQFWTFCDAQPQTITQASNGWGALSRMDMPSGARVDYTYSLTSVHELNEPNNLARERLQTKTVTHDSTTDIWDYTDGVLGPDGSHTRLFTYPLDSGWPLNYGGSNGLGGLVYKVDYSGKKIVERRWVRKMFDTANAIVSVGQQANFNAVISEEYRTVVGSPSKMTATTFEYDFNGNLTKETQYDWFDPALVTRDQDTPNLPQGVPQGVAKLREVTNTYHNDATQLNSPNVYAKRLIGDPPTPFILNAVKETTIGDGTTTLSKTRLHYDLQGFNTPPFAGNVTKEQRDKDGAWIDVTHTYDSHGNRTSTTDPRLNVTQFFYEDQTMAQPTRIVVDPNNQVTGDELTSLTAYDFATGLPISVTDPNGRITSSVYTNQLLLGTVDPFHRPGVVTDPQGRKAVIRYFDNGRQLEVWSDLNNPFDAKLRTRTSGDQLGRAIKTESSEDGVSYTISSQTLYKNDPIAKQSITKVSNPSRGNGALTDGWGRAIRDDLGRVIEVATFSGSPSSPPPDSGTNGNWTGSVSTIYNAEQTTVTDQAGKKRRSFADGLGRLKQVDELFETGALYASTFYTYDVLGNLTQVQQGSSQFRTFVYDALSRLTQATNPESETINYTYDDNSNLQTKADARSVVTTFAYDGLNRVTTRTYSGPAPGGTTPGVTYSYDNAAVSNSKGRLTSVSSSVSSYSYGSYDVMGRVVTGTQTTDGQSYAMSYQYNLAGATTSETYPSGRVVATEYDTAGRMAGVKKDLTTYYAGGTPGTSNAMSYTAHGAAATMRLGNGRWEHTNFNSRLQPLQIGLGTSATNSSILQLDYGYGTATNNGNVLSQNIVIGATTISQNYSYDALNRLQTASENSGAIWSQTYGYDRYGNRWVSNSFGYTLSSLTPQSQGAFNAANNRLFASGYDSAGNQTTDAQSRTFTYDAENRQKTFNATAGQYFYDGDGRRVKKIDASGTTVFVYNAGGQLIAEYHSDPVPPPAGGGGTSYLTSDHLGSTRVVTDAQGDVKARHDYLPFGEELGAGIGQRTGAMKYDAPDSTKQKFTQKERDSESGLDYFLARYYSSAQGRFTSPDEFTGGPDEFWVLGSGDSKKQALVYADVTNPQSLNKYQYCYNNPLRYVDPNGKWPTGIHKQIFENAFPGLTSSQIRILVRAGERVDKDQSQKGAYKHSMRAPNQSIDEAKNETATFIGQSEDKAKQFQTEFKEQGGKGLSNDALDAAGEGLHAVTDGTSPAHQDKQGNPEVWNVGKTPERYLVVAGLHGLKERKISPEQMKDAVNAARQQFGKIFGDKELKQATTVPKSQTKEPRTRRRNDE